jgi:hypothetical protein
MKKHIKLTLTEAENIAIEKHIASLNGCKLATYTKSVLLNEARKAGRVR